MKTEVLDKLKALRSFSVAAGSWWAKYREAIKNPSCDKYGAGFNHDDRFPVFKLKSLDFSAHTGYYGDSGCSTFGSLNSELAAFYLPKALSAMAPDIFTKMADLAAADAAKIAGEAEAELERLRQTVEAAKA